MKLRRIAFASACLLFAGAGVAQSPSNGTLYAQLGGRATVAAFVGEAVDKAKVPQLKGLLITQICSRTGGGCDLAARDSLEHPISDAEFTGLVETLRQSMRSHAVPIAARNQLLEILAPLRRDLVGP